jgi:hypothetical protein
MLDPTNFLGNGSFTRREWLRRGAAGFTSLTLSDLFRLRAVAAAKGSAPSKSLLIVWLHGGASHLETYDPKPLAASEFCGPYGAIETSVPGLQISELLPMQAKLAHRFTLLRSLVHTGFCHGEASMLCEWPSPILPDVRFPSYKTAGPSKNCSQHVQLPNGPQRTSHDELH